MSSPIQLVDYVPEEVHFEVNPAYRTDKEQAGSVKEPDDVDVTLEVDWSDPEPPNGSDKSDGERNSSEVLYLSLTVQVSGNEDFSDGWPYRIRLQHSGLFERAAPEDLFDEGEGDGYLTQTIASCISILYGTVRSEIASLTAQTPYGKFLLPAFPPLEVARELVQDQQSTVAKEEDAYSEGDSPKNSR